MLGLLGLRIFEATSANIGDLGEEHGHRVLRVCDKAPRSSSSRCRQPSPGPSAGPSPTAPTDRSCSTAAAAGWTGTRPPAACADSPKPPASRSPGHTRTCSATPSSPPCSTQASTCAMSRSPPPRRPAHHDALRPGPPEPRPPPELHPRRLHGLRHLTPPASPAPSLRKTHCIADVSESSRRMSMHVLEYSLVPSRPGERSTRAFSSLWQGIRSPNRNSWHRPGGCVKLTALSHFRW
jgi:hypothetical protein